MRKFKLLFAVLLCYYLPVFAETHLSENIGGQTLNSAGSPYIVESDLTIPVNSQVVIKPGTVILFRSFTGINVYGSVLVEGTKDNPVIFTSINDANYNENAEQLPNSFDWNGIYINEKAGDIKFRNFKLMYSVFGIKSQKDDITIQNGFFKQNGQFHFTIRDNIHYVQDNISYSYNASKDQEQAAIESGQEKAASQDKGTVTEGKDPGKSEKREKTKSGRGRRIAAFTFLGIGVATGASTLITGIKAVQYNKKAEDPQQPPGNYDYYKDKWNTTKNLTMITGIACGITLPLSLFLFIKKEKSTTEKKITLNIETCKNMMGVGFTRYF
jgi:hypothetical protein